jgi:predicted RNA-binding Zn-ribbon protein involved in translation (DUF1610 family)
MAFCSNCGTKLEEGVKFCPSCGTQTGNAAVSKAAEKVGTIRKCPACGAEVESFQATCSSCGHEFSNIKVTSSVQQFFEKLVALDQHIYETGNDTQSIGTSLLNMYGLGGTRKGDKRRINLIEGFPIPNTKEDILEFMIMASSRINHSGVKWMGNPNAIMESRELAKYNNAWKSKIKQAYTKAKIAFVGDKETMAQITLIMDEIAAEEKKARIRRTVIIAIIVVVFIGLYGGLGILAATVMR